MNESLKKIFSFIIVLFSILITFQVPVKAQTSSNVLILHSYSSSLQWTSDIQNGMNGKFRLKNNILLNYEFMDSKYNNSDEYLKMLCELYKTKYKDVKFDAIICSDNDALNFIINYGEELFGKCPVVFCGINDFDESMLKGKTNFTGVLEKIEVEETIKAILTIQPDIENVVVICDSTTTGKINERLAKKAVERINSNVKFHFYRDVKATEILNKINILGQNTAVLDLAQLKSENGRYIPYEKTENEFAEFKNPVYVCWDFLLTDKVVGGKVIDGYNQGKTAAEMVIRILGGEDIKNIPVIKESQSNFVFNYNGLKKYNVKLGNLGSEYKIINKPVSVYEIYKEEIITIIVIIIFLVICIIILVLNIKTRILTEEELKKNYEELNLVYEELAATEEELQVQYSELEISEERYKLAVDGSNDVIWEYNFETKNFFISDRSEALLGYKVDFNEDCKSVMKNIIVKEDLDKVLDLVNRELSKKSPYFQVECRIVNKLNELNWIFIRGKALIDSTGKPIKMSGSISDITERKKSEEKNKFLAFYDQLTGLPNKHMFSEILDAELAKAGEGGAVFFIDIDNFKSINDILGHDYGDELLKHISKVFLESLKHDEFICRHGGDEFLILSAGAVDYYEIEKTAIKILNLFKNPFNVGGKKIFITASIGISMFPKDGLTKNELLKSADIAMYKAKEKGKNRYLFYDRSMIEHVIRKSGLIDGLRYAIERSEFRLLYQPQVNLIDGKVKGAEVLIRWTSPNLGKISPAEFIPLAEQTEFIVPLGKWILKKACQKNKEWIDKGLNPITVSVNVSVMQLYNDDFLATIKEVLEETELPPEYLEIEITESVVMNQMEENLKILNEIKKLGIKIALDDFGTGYSSLSYLRLLPINKLKLDKSFVDNICIYEKDKGIVESIIKLAHKMNIVVISEGVETKEQFDILKDIGCDKIQGYYFSKPISEDEFEIKYL